MTRARILADYVAGGTTATEFDYLDGLTSTAVGINDTQTLANKTLASTTSFPAGHVIQVVNRSSTTSYNWGSGTSSFEELVDYYVTISPKKATSHIYVTFSFPIINYANSSSHYFKIEREITGGATTTNLISATEIGTTTSDGYWVTNWINYTWVDSPSTTSAVKYQPYIACSNNLNTDEHAIANENGTARSWAMEVMQ